MGGKRSEDQVNNNRHYMLEHPCTQSE